VRPGEAAREASDRSGIEAAFAALATIKPNFEGFEINIVVHQRLASHRTF
jgi:hypothetical protein